MAPNILKTFKKQLKITLEDLLDYSDFGSFVYINILDKEINKINSIDVKLETFEKIYKET